MLPSVVISVHAVVLECWPYFSVAGDQQGCDFNSVDFDRIRNFNLVDLHRFNSVEFDVIRNNRQQKSPTANRALSEANTQQTEVIICPVFKIRKSH